MTMVLVALCVLLVTAPAYVFAVAHPQAAR